MITLTDVRDGLAHLTIRSTIPREELEKLTMTLLEKIKSGGLSDEKLAQAKAALSGAAEFREETIADYRIDVENGLLQSFQSKQTISVSEGGKTNNRVKVHSLKRVD